MSEVGTYEAKTHLAALLDRVERGEEITITRHGRPVARLVPVTAAGRSDLDAVFEEMDRLRRGNRLDGLSLRELIEEGRR